MYPILFKYGRLEIYTYGVFLAMAFYFAVQWAVRSSRERKFDEELVLNLAIVSILSAILGARLTYVYVYWEKYINNYIEIIQIYKGGLVFYGGLIGGVSGGVAYWWYKGQNVLSMADCAAMAVSLGQGIGRIGCYFYGCCYGQVLDPNSFWFQIGIQFPGQTVYRYPTQIISSVGNFIIFGLLIYIFKKAKHGGMVVVGYCYIYGVFRFLIECFRADPRGTVLGVQSLSTSQTISILAILLGTGLHIYIVKSGQLLDLEKRPAEDSVESSRS